MRTVPVAAGVLLAACGSGAGPGRSDDPTLHVVTTVAPITSIVANVGGDLVDIAGLVPEGTNSHTFEPPPSAAAVLSDADVLFLNGLGLEDPIQDLADENLPHDAVAVRLGEASLTPDEYIYDFSFPKDGGRPNPHLWTDPPLAKRYAEIVADTLAAADPPHAAAFRANERAFAGKVDALDAAMTEATASIPPASRKLLTYHDAYAYFADDYGWDVIGAIQPSDFHDPTSREVAGLIDQVRAEHVPVVFGSEVFPSPVLEQIGRETGARYVDVLRDDDLPGGPGDADHSWLALMRFDFVTMVDALGGDTSTLDRLDISDVVPDTADYPQ